MIELHFAKIRDKLLMTLFFSKAKPHNFCKIKEVGKDGKRA